MKSNSQMMDVKALTGVVTSAVEAAISAYFAHTVPTRTAPKVDAKQAPKVAPKSAPKTGAFGADADPNIVVLTVSPDAQDARVKLPARMFDANGICVVDGTKFAAGTDKGRTKVQPNFFGAERGDTITLQRERGNRWFSTVNEDGALKAPAKQAPAKQAPARKASVARVAPMSTSPKAAKVAPKVAAKPTPKSSAAAIAALMAKTADQAIAGYGKGRENENLPADDARRYLTSGQKKAFNVESNALGLKLADAITMLNAEVFA